jgi:hypothetical protein
MEKLKQEDIQELKVNIKEVVSEMKLKSELIKNFHEELEVFRRNKDRIGYNTKFKELLKKEEDIQYGRKN